MLTTNEIRDGKYETAKIGLTLCQLSKLSHHCPNYYHSLGNIVGNIVGIASLGMSLVHPGNRMDQSWVDDSGIT